MFKQKIILSIIALSFLMIASQAIASTSDGTIDSTYRYAWGENVGFIDFGSTAGNVHITDEGLSGYAYGENIGWINLSTITNDGEGTLSGYAWGENVGFIDFGKVTIDNHGYFLGQAYSENVGWILFNKDSSNNVMTDWRPESSRRSHSSSGSTPTSKYVAPVVTKPVTPTITETNCNPGQLYNTQTGAPCTTFNLTVDQTLNITRILKLTIPMMKGEDVKQLQTYLNTHNYNCGLADGIFGQKTKQAVIKFQLANQLIGDGIVGPKTIGKMK